MGFSHLSRDIRLLIWEITLRRPRIVYIKMRQIPKDPNSGAFCMDSCDDDLKFEGVTSTPVPVLLHVCSESRSLALDFYELTFGRANAPIYQPRHIEVYDPDFVRFPYHRPGPPLESRKIEFVVESNEHEVAKYAPKTYFNFEHDTIVIDGSSVDGEEECDATLRGIGYSMENHQSTQVQRIKNLAFIIRLDWANDWIYSLGEYMKNHVNLDMLKTLTFCLETDDLDPSKELEIVDLHQRGSRKGQFAGVAEEIINRWRAVFEQVGIVVGGLGLQGLKSVCEGPWNGPRTMKAEFLRHGTNPDEGLKWGLLRNVKR
ncbi:hypothetical protein BKA61DRAFT_617789 [Leptodontidium sp. MPI-SDFR-AT-0119]|nr:hypothetical protein BKA61DRAFT_617789 [Leptodontidium sp. MPI-SDFR-AT-0119]